MLETKVGQDKMKEMGKCPWHKPNEGHLQTKWKHVKTKIQTKSFKMMKVCNILK
jgi:hypothetical protein